MAGLVAIKVLSVNFENFNLYPQILAGVQAQGFTVPTPIQSQAIPPGLAGRDVLGLAQTGTGKTAAFVLPILQRLLKGQRGRVRALIIAPTRELAEQINDTISALGQKTGLRSVTVYGGVSMEPQIRKLRGQTEIVVACPGRLLDHMGQKTINLAALEVLVLDEADRMFDMGFLPDVRRILQQLPSKRQTMLFSATMPADIRSLADDVLNDPTTVQIGITAPAVTVSHALYPVVEGRKTALLMELLQQTDTESVLIFTRTKHRAKKLALHLDNSGYNAVALQGNMSQNARQAAMNGFRSGQYKIMVATDIAARGIDVTQISHVINYDIPDTVDAYTHRIGRTGRAAKTGDAYTLVTQEDREMVRDIEKVLGKPIERKQLSGFDYAGVDVAKLLNGSQAVAPARTQPGNGHRPPQRNGARPNPQRSPQPGANQPASGQRAPQNSRSRAASAQHASQPAPAAESTGAYRSASRRIRRVRSSR